MLGRLGMRRPDGLSLAEPETHPTLDPFRDDGPELPPHSFEASPAAAALECGAESPPQSGHRRMGRYQGYWSVTSAAPQRHRGDSSPNPLAASSRDAVVHDRDRSLVAPDPRLLLECAGSARRSPPQLRPACGYVSDRPGTPRLGADAPVHVEGELGDLLDAAQLADEVVAHLLRETALIDAHVVADTCSASRAAACRSDPR